MHFIRRIAPSAALAALGLAAQPAQAQVTALANFQQDVSTQTGAASASEIGWYLNTRLFITSSTDVATATLSYPGAGSPAAYSRFTPIILQYFTPFYASQPDLQAAIPFGDYTASYGGGSKGTGSVTISYTQHPFPVQPLFAASTYSGVRGLNAAAPFTFTWSSFANPTSDAFAFFSVTDADSGVTAFSGSFLSPSTLSQTVPSGTLTPGHSYTAEIDFSSRLDGVSNGIPTTQGFDRGTLLTFTAAPEPSQFAALGVGVLGVCALALKARKRGAA